MRADVALASSLGRDGDDTVEFARALTARASESSLPVARFSDIDDALVHEEHLTVSRTWPPRGRGLNQAVTQEVVCPFPRPPCRSVRFPVLFPFLPLGIR